MCSVGLSILNVNQALPTNTFWIWYLTSHVLAKYKKNRHRLAWITWRCNRLKQIKEKNKNAIQRVMNPMAHQHRFDVHVHKWQCVLTTRFYSPLSPTATVGQAAYTCAVVQCCFLFELVQALSNFFIAAGKQCTFTTLANSHEILCCWVECWNSDN